MYYLGIDLGGTFIKAGVVDKDGNILHKVSLSTEVEKGAEHIVSQIAKAAAQAADAAGVPLSSLQCAGIASPGTADREKGVIVYCSSMPFLNFPLAQKVAARTGIDKVYVENDANAAAWGESVFGAAKGYQNSVMLTLGTGIGGGIMIGGSIYAGANFAAAEVGHMVIDPAGPECQCGRKGCFEKLASATALIRFTREEMAKHPDSVMWRLCHNDLSQVDAKISFDARRLGDEGGTRATEKFIYYLSLGITNIINLLQPEIITIGGGVSNEGDYLLNPVREIIAKKQYSRYSEKKTIVQKAALGNDAGVIGAAMLGM